MMITVTADAIKEFETMLRNEQFPESTLEAADVDHRGVVRLILHPKYSSRSFVATLQLTTLEEI